MISKIDKNSVRKARHFRTRRYISGTQERPGSTSIAASTTSTCR